MMLYNDALNMHAGIGEIVRSPAPPGVPELKLHSIMIK